MEVTKDTSWTGILLQYGLTPVDLIAFGAALMAFVSIIAFGRGFMQRDRMAARMRALKDRRAELKSAISSPRSRKRVSSENLSRMQDIVKKLHMLQEAEVKKVSRILVGCGIRNKDAIVVFLFMSLVLPLLFLGIAMILVPWHDMMVAKWKWLIPFLAAYVGYKFPAFIMGRRCKKRMGRIRIGIADGLDLMMVCAEAGLTLGASLDRVSRQLGISYPDLADELALTAIEIGFLPDRKSALDNLHERVNLAEVKGIVNVLIQTEKYGTPIAQALRTLSTEFRQQRLLRAEQRAARLPALMTVPMIVFILPTIFIVVMSPAIIKLLDQIATKF